MVDLLPYRPEVTNRGRREPVVFDLASDQADRVFKSLSSDTARQVLQTLYEQPRVASEIAEKLDTSLQNVDYHLRNLQEADLVEVVDTWYSRTGNEMKVYAPTAQAVMVSSDPEQTSRLRSMASSLIASVIALGAVAAVFRYVALEWLITEPAPGEDVDDSMIMEEPATPVDPVAELPTLLDPGVVFLLGGLAALLVVGCIWYARRSIGGPHP